MVIAGRSLSRMTAAEAQYACEGLLRATRSPLPAR